MSSNPRNWLDWPEGSAAFMRERPDGRLFDCGQDIAVWLQRADGFRWAADMAVTYAEQDYSGREQASAQEIRDAGSLEALHSLSDAAVDRAYECLSESDGPIDWFGLTCAVGELYRHYVELLLKVVVILTRRIQNEESSFPRTHDLRTLWQVAHSRMRAIWPNRDGETPEAFDRATEHVSWLAGVDPNAQSFRYPSAQGFARDDALPLMKELRAHVVPLGNYLRKAAGGMWAVRDEQAQYEEDMNANVPDIDHGI